MKNCLAVVGLLVILLVTLLIAGGLYWIYQGQPLPAQGGQSLSGSLFGGTPQINVVGGESQIQKESLLPTIAPPTPLPTATPIPDPVVYRSQVMLMAKRFGVALDSFYQENSKLAQDNSLLNNAEWQREMGTVLDELAASAQALATISPVPAEDQALQADLAQIGPETQAFRESYIQGMQTGDEASLKTAGDHLTQIQALMMQAQGEAAKAGWK